MRPLSRSPDTFFFSLQNSWEPQECVCVSVFRWTLLITELSIWHTLFHSQPQRQDEARAGQRDQVKICQMGRQRKKPAHKPSLGWFIGLISENGKVKLITFPPEIAAQQWQMTSCQGQTVSHPWGVRRSALSSDSLTRGAALPDAPLWMAGARRTGASPAPSFFTPPQLGNHAGA